MPAIRFDYHDGKHTLIVHEKTDILIRIETDPTWPGWIEIGRLFSNNLPILLETDGFDEWNAFVEMVTLADQVKQGLVFQRHRPIERNRTIDGQENTFDI